MTTKNTFKAVEYQLEVTHTNLRYTELLMIRHIWAALMSLMSYLFTNRTGSSRKC